MQELSLSISEFKIENVDFTKTSYKQQGIQNKAGGSPLPKSNFQELGIFHLEDFNEQLPACCFEKKKERC